MVSATVRSGTRLISWNAVWMPSRWASDGHAIAAGAPKTRISPELGRIRPESSLTVVDLPAPFSPSSAWTSPAATRIVAPPSATVAP